MRPTDRVEQTYIGCSRWTIERFDILGQSGGVLAVDCEAAADALAMCEARQLDPFADRENLKHYISKLR